MIIELNLSSRLAVVRVILGRQVAYWLEHWASNRKAAGSNPQTYKVKKNVVLPLNKALSQCSPVGCHCK